MTIPRVYVAGKYTGPTLADRKLNAANAVHCGVEICKLGAYPVVPHSMGIAVDKRGDPHSYEWWIEATARDLLTCDAVFLVPGWELSSGARSEARLADESSIPAFTEMAALKTWLESRATKVSVTTSPLCTPTSARKRGQFG